MGSGRVPLVEGELVEVELRRLDLVVVADLVAEAEKGVLDLASRLRERVQVAEREPLAGERDVDDVLGQSAVELGPLEGSLACVDGGLDRLSSCIERHARLAVTHLAERELEGAAPPEIADAQLFQLRSRRGSLDRAQGLTLERLRVHARDCIAWLRHGPGYLVRIRRASAPVPGEKPRPGKERTCARRGHLSTRYSENGCREPLTSPLRTSTTSWASAHDGGRPVLRRAGARGRGPGRRARRRERPSRRSRSRGRRAGK